MIGFCVTGAPRSTTLWSAKAFTMAGLPCHHEYACSAWTDTYGDNGVWASAPPCGESAAQAAPFTPLMRDAGVRVIHLIREPLACVASMIGWGLLDDDETIPFHHFITAHVGNIWAEYDRLPDRGLAFWTRWNNLIESDIRLKAPILPAQIWHIAETWFPDTRLHTIGHPPPANLGTPVELAVDDFKPDLWDEATTIWATV